MLQKFYDRQLGAMFGLAVGDALGAPVEFNARDTFEPITTMVPGGYFDLPAGAWTDDTAMSLALFFSLQACGNLNAEHLLTEFYEWFGTGKYSSTGRAVGLGQNTFWVLSEFKRKGTLIAGRQNNKSDGNGSLMRLAPVPIMFVDDRDKALRIAVDQSRTTHASNPAAEACFYACHILIDLLRGEQWRDAIRHAPQGLNALENVASLDWKTKSRDEISSSGYVVHTLEAALWCVETTNSFDEAVLVAANLGDDADTVAAVTGQFAGACYGYTSINPHWVSLLKSHGYPNLRF